MPGAGQPLLRLDDELGLVRFCYGCREWWPSDEEFWRPEHWSRRAVCRACADEGRRESMKRASRRYRAKRDEEQASVA